MNFRLDKKNWAWNQKMIGIIMLNWRLPIILKKKKVFSLKCIFALKCSTFLPCNDFYWRNQDWVARERKSNDIIV